ncbi:MAG: PA domain-containing protein [Steroidobacteraceae bacterium]
MNKNILKAITATALLAGATTAWAAEMVLVNTDPSGFGFNDPTPATPVGGNAGTTVGEQRLIAYGRALQLWGSILKSDVPVVVLGSFQPRPCEPTGGVLASAGAWNIELDFPNAPLAGHWYHSALANSIAGVDLYPGDDSYPDGAVIDGADIIAFFNSELGTPACLTTSSWYYGLDNNANTAAGQIDFLDTFMHELSHGLGFSNFADESVGLGFFGLPDVYMANTRDNVTGKIWNVMTPGQIITAAVSSGQEVWNGARVTASAPSVLGPLIQLQVTAPAGLAGSYEYGTASFGAVATPANFSGSIVLGLDDNLSGSVNDGCSAFTNAAAVNGNIAFVRRGVCGFAAKAKNAQNAGATGVIIANNAIGGNALGLGGVDPTVTIPAISVATNVGNAFIAANTVATGGLGATPGRLAGTDIAGRVRLYAPTTFAPGSSISHYDTAATPDLLMEPFISPTLASATNVDLTAALFEDIGWKTEMSIADCGKGSGTPATLLNGQSLAAPVFICANNAKNKGQFQSCSTQYLNSLKKVGVIDGATKGKFSSCTASGK